MDVPVFIFLKWLVGFPLLWRVPCSRSPDSTKESGPTLSVIIPARNEEQNLPKLLVTLASQSIAPHEVIVVDDNSTDATARCAGEWGASVIDPGTVPVGWTGKTWACWKGAHQATGDIFLFLDADTRLAPDGLERMRGAFRAQERGLLSFYPYHLMEKVYERLSAFFNLVCMMSLGIATVAGSRLKPIGAFGACILCRRDDYFMCGGHKAVMGKIMEDVALGQVFRRKGLPMNCLAGRGTIAFCMYPDGIRQMIEGWSKNFASGARASRLSLLLLVIVWVTGALQAVIQAAGIPFHGTIDQCALACAPYAAYALQIHWMLRRLGNFGITTAVLFPVPLLFFVGVFAYSLVITFVVGRVRWRGRSITLDKTAERRSCST